MEDRKEGQNWERTRRSMCRYKINHNAGRVDLSLERSVVGRPQPSGTGPRIRKEENRQWCNGGLRPGEAANHYLGMERGGRSSSSPES